MLIAYFYLIKFIESIHFIMKLVITSHQVFALGIMTCSFNGVTCLKVITPSAVEPETKMLNLIVHLA